ncbi:unnamed protein product [Parascedosporium putredinis]|uniref:Acid phosphatase-like protein n=1 Tax=Parascedosporium putredinis TaxID=1442378 RepID=A0A9P1GYD6_9PEZI|nr:unnamed protein product [Parascedosporium putredinis]CAI7990649.1 unnamed protein product [Parascedosporium putredinis]
MVNVAGGIVIAIVVIAVVAALGWVAFTQLRARRLGLPPPSFSSYIPFKKSNDSPFDSRASQGGVVGWVNDRVRGFKQRNNRTARGAYEPSGGNAARGTMAALTPTKLGILACTTSDDLGGSGYEMNLPRTPAARSPAPQEERRGRQPAERNPFDDDAEPSNISVRKISPRPLDTGAGRAGGRKEDDSPTDRRSMFREEV